MPTDPNLQTLNQLADQYHSVNNEAQRLRRQLDLHIQELKREGYSYRVLARESQLANGTIQRIVAKDTHT